MKELICITCPNGCLLTAEDTPEGTVIKGHKCPRGQQYGLDELTNPKRTVTAVIPSDSADWPCIPVRSTGPVPRPLIPALIEKLYSISVSLPVLRGKVVLANYEKTGIDIVCTRSLPPLNNRGKQ
jgi:CxxC motif-containing protein